MAANLPPIPRVVFTILEPISLIAGWLGPIISTKYFVSNQLPTHALPFETHEYPLRPHETILALQLGNCYLLLALLGLFILNTTTELRVVKAYLWALWLGDIGHVAVTTHCMGWTGTVEVWNWNAVIIGNIIATVFLFAVRSLYFLGAFGGVEAGKVQGRRGARAKIKQRYTTVN